MENENTMLKVSSCRKKIIQALLMGILIGMFLMFLLHYFCLLPASTYNKCCSPGTSDSAIHNDYITHSVSYATDSAYRECTDCDTFLPEGPDMGFLVTHTFYEDQSNDFYAMREHLPMIMNKGARMHKCVLETILSTMRNRKDGDDYVYFRFGLEPDSMGQRIYIMARGGDDWRAGAADAGLAPTFSPELLPITYRNGTTDRSFCPVQCR